MTEDEARKLRVLAVQDRYNSSFNTPRVSRHEIERRRFVPFNHICKPLEGATLVNPWPPKPFDLVHAFNRIPFGPTPFVIGFESHLPRAFGREGGAIARVLVDRLLDANCRRIVPMSHAAERTFLAQNGDHPELDTLKSKITVRLPNIFMPEPGDWFDPAERLSELRLLFVGGHFARKGGCVAVRIAQKAAAAGAPIKVAIISAMEFGAKVWTDPADPSFYEPYLKLLELPNVTFLRGAPNAKVLEFAARTHVSLLPTMGDTFGYSAIEGMSRYTPVIATRQGALPEFIDNANGVMLDLETSAVGEWAPPSRCDRASSAYAKDFRDNVERLADEAYAACLAMLDDPSALAAKRQGARATIEEKFDAVKAGRFWDDLYVEAAKAPRNV